MTQKAEWDTGKQVVQSLNMKYRLIFEGLAVGILASLVSVLYRLALDYSEQGLHRIIDAAKQNIWIAFVWFAALIGMALIVGLLIKAEPMISGSGIPQVEGEFAGYLDPCWWKVIMAKLAGGILCIFGGLSLGREGPSIQLGAMAGKGFSRTLRRPLSEEHFLLSCGASAGLSAAFNAPLAGIVFALEELHKTFSVQALLCTMTASLTADFISKNVFGLSPIFHFSVEEMVPLEHYWMLVLLGLLLGVMGVIYNFVILGSQTLYGKLKWIKPQFRLIIPFLCAGALGFLLPEILGGGHTMIELLSNGKLAIGAMLFLFLAKFLFSALCFGSGAPGGIFFPLLVLGAYLGGVFGSTMVQTLGIDPSLINNFIILAMAGYFTAIVRAPITGIVLVSEMSGSFSHLLSLGVVSIAAYLVAEGLKSAPIYESLLERILKKQQFEEPKHAQGARETVEVVIEAGSVLEQKTISSIQWPEDCLLVAIRRGTSELIPKGDTVLHPGDTMVALTDETNAPELKESLQKLASV